MNCDSVSDEPLGALSLATTKEAREALLRDHPSLASPETVEALYDQVAHDLRVDLRRAGLAARSSLWLAKQIEHAESIALSLRAIGNVQLLQDKPDQALRHFNEALDLFQQSEAHEQTAQTHLNLLAAYLSLGDYQAAHETGTRAQSLLSELGDSLGLARLENNLGGLLFRQEDYAQARTHWRSALSTFRDLGHSHDAAIALRNLAVCEISLNNFRSALEIYEEVSQYCKEHELTLLLHEIDYNIAYLYFLRGDHDRALDGYRLARNRSLEFGDAYHAALCDLDEAELYLEINLLPDSLSLAQRASVEFERLGRVYEAAKAQAFQAVATARSGDDHRALAVLYQAHEAFSSQGHLAWASLTLLYQALLFFREGRRFESRRATTQALAGFEQLDNPGKCALCELLIARLSLESDELLPAQQAAGAALERLQGSDLPHILFQAYLVLGEVAEATEDYYAARDSYYTAIELLQSLRTQLSATDLHIPFPSPRLAVYDRLLQLEHMLSSSEALPALAFSLMEQEKARTISDLLGSRASFLSPSEPARSGLVEQVRGLREELRWYYKKVSHREMLSSRKSESSSKPAFQQMERKILASLTEIAKDDREYGYLHQTLSIELEQVLDLLVDDEVVLEYFVGQDVITLLFVSKKHSFCQPVAVSSEIIELRRLLDFQVSRLDRTAGDGKRRLRSIELARQCLRSLYRELVGPVSDHLSAFSRVKIAPHGFLAYLPFHAFVAEEAHDSDLGDLYTCSYVPSLASLFFARRRRRTGNDEQALLFEDPGEKKESGTLGRTLPWSTEVVPPGSDRGYWEERLRRPWKLVQIPLHASYRLDNPALSSLSISGTQLTLLDLFQVEVGAETLVVTHCGPSPSRLGAGDELLCLSRGLLYSGPGAVVLPLRKSRPAPHEAVLTDFYSNLATGLAADVALQQSQASCKKIFPHMADWAPLVVYGL